MYRRVVIGAPRPVVNRGCKMSQHLLRRVESTARAMGGDSRLRQVRRDRRNGLANVGGRRPRIET